MTSGVIKTALALHALVLFNTTAYAQTAQKTTPAASQTDQHQVEQQATSLQANIGQALKLKKLDQKTANTLLNELAEVKTSVASLAKQQGFVSAAENASYQRVFTKAERALVDRK